MKKNILVCILLASLVYGFFSNYHVTSNMVETPETVFGVHSIPFPMDDRVTVKDNLTAMDGFNNGFLFFGVVLKDFFKNAWEYYTDFPNNFLFKIIWVVLGIFVAIIKSAFISLCQVINGSVLLLTWVQKANIGYYVSYLVTLIVLIGSWVGLGKDDDRRVVTIPSSKDSNSM